MEPNQQVAQNIIKGLGLEVLPEEKKVQMLEKMTELVQKRVMLRVMELLSNEQAEEMAAKESNPVEMLAYIAEKVPNFDSILQEEISVLREEVLGVAKEV